MNFDLAFYWKLLLRRLPVMALFILACGSLSVITAIKLPETYSTAARLLVEAPQIPDSMVASTIQTDVVEQLDIIQQKLLTRANLIDIANRFSVFQDIGDLDPDTVVELMLQGTKINRSAGRNQATLMTLSFEARNGGIAANVVNEYVTLVLDENSNSRISSAENTLQFFEQEIARLSQELDRKSAAIVVFKSENSEALPEEQSYRLGRQALLQERLSRLERERSAAETQRREVVQIYDTTGTVQQGVAQQNTSPEQQQLIVAKAELEQALSIYSNTHPRVIRLSARVERLEAIVSAQVATVSGEGSETEVASPQQALLQVTLAEIDNRLEFISSDLSNTEDELEEIQKNISSSSSNGIQLASLERELAGIQAQYNAALSNLNQARMSERIETTAQGQRITIIENATVPTSPTGPNRLKIIALGSFIGIALAGGYFAMLEFFNRSIRRPAEMQSRFQITPITTIPYMESRTRKLGRRTGLVLATLAVLIGVPAGLWYVDTNYLPLELVVQKGLDKLGLG